MKKVYIIALVLLTASFQMNAQCYSYSAALGAPQYFHDGLDLYLASTDCSGSFNSVGGGPIMFAMESVDLEYYYDYLRFYDGPDTSYPLLTEITGQLAAQDLPVFTSTSSVVHFTFHSDESYQYAGWAGWATEVAPANITESGSRNEMNIYPNPSNGLTSIVLPAQNTNYQLDIFDLSGKLLRSELVTAIAGSNVQKFDFTALSGGQYLLVLRNNDVHVTSLLSIR